MGVIEQVVEKSCLSCFGCGIRLSKTNLDVVCKACGGTGLLWNTLSRKCSKKDFFTSVVQKGERGHFSCMFHGYPHDTPHCPEDKLCGGTGRIPDVTLEKVQMILLKAGHPITIHGLQAGGVQMWLHQTEGPYEGDLLEAACAALLASVEK